ncbi:MAG: MFS transporter [Ktedonobacterales bacterium]
MTREAADATATPSQPEPNAANWHENWRVLLVFFTLAGVVESQAFGHLGAFTPLFLQQLGVAQQQVPQWTGVLQSLGFVIGLPLLPFWGVWADRYGRKLIIVRSAYCEGIIFTVAALSPNVWVLALARFLGGFVLGNTGVMLALLADRTPRRRLGLAVGIASAGFPLGSALGPFLGGVIAQGPGIRTLLLFDACLSALMGVVLTVVIRERRATTGPVAPVGQLLRVAVGDIVKSPVVVRLFALYFAAMFGISLVTPFIPILLQRLYHGTLATVPSMIGTTLTAAGIAMAVTTPLWGRAGDVIGRWVVLPICLGAVGVGVLVEGLAPALLPLQGAIVWVGLFQGGIGATVIALLALLSSPERRNAILNFALLPSQLSWFIGPLAGAGLAAVTFRLPYYAGALCLALAAGLAIAVARSSHATPAPHTREAPELRDGSAATATLTDAEAAAGHAALEAEVARLTHE